MARRLFGLLLFLGCSPDPSGRAGLALTDAMDDTGHPSVGRYLFSTDGATQNAGCTATVIGTHTLLTAGHCAGYDMNEVELGDPAVRYSVERDLAHPQFDSGQAWLRDLALIVTNDPLPYAPVPVERRVATIGESVTLVGFGETSLGAMDNGVKRVAHNDVEDLEDQYFTVDGSGQGEGNGCRGDSGGPALVEGEGASVLGVMSFVPGLGSGCGDSTWITRLDLYAQWIATASEDDVVFADHSVPQIRILAPQAGETVHSPAQLQVVAMDDQGVRELIVSIDGVPYASVPAGSYTEAIDLGLGQRRISAVAKDAAGNEGTAEIEVQVVAESEPPDDGGCSAVGRPGLEALLLMILLGIKLRRAASP